MSTGDVVLPFDPSGIALDPAKGLGRELYQVLRGRILDGRLGSGTRLPASRELGALLGISRNTVIRAYDQLYAEGFIESRVGDGTYVTSLNKLSTQLPTGLPPGLPTGLSTFHSDDTEDSYSLGTIGSVVLRLQSHHLPSPKAGAPRAFRVGIPAFDQFPFEVWAKLQAGFWRNPSLARLGYGDPAGERELRELIATYLRRSRGLACAAEQIVITQGAQEAISLCAQLLLEQGACVAVENPGYRAAAHALTLAGAQVTGVPVDNEGIDCTVLESLPACRLVYVTPAHQYPTGVTLSLARRLALLEWASRTQGWIIEDDYDGEYRYSGAPLAPLAALDRQARVIYVGTFGKVAFPALRLGYLVLPNSLTTAFARARALHVRHSEVSTQCVMAQFMIQGEFQRHIRRMRRAALARRDALLAAWPQGVPSVGPMPTVSAGLHLALPVQGIERERELIGLAETVGVEINALSDYWLAADDHDRPAPAGLVLGFAAVAPTAIKAACDRLRDVWR